MKIKSIRRFLFLSLIILIGLTASVTIIGNYLLDKKDTLRNLERQLQETAAVIANITDRTNKGAPILIKTSSRQEPQYKIFDKNITILMSDNFPDITAGNLEPGINNITVNNTKWLLYKTHAKNKSYDIITATKMVVAKNLARDIVTSDFYLMLIMFPVLGILIWLIINVAIRHITRISAEISTRSSAQLEPITTSDFPIEIRPLLTELNGLFSRLKESFIRNRRFAADAAHELRTPLAALKTQAQVAVKTNAPEKKVDKLLQNIINSVDRCSHVVTQLLTLSHVDREKTLNDIRPLNLHKLTAEIVAYMVPLALEKNIEIDLSPPPENPIILGSDTTLGILIRNIVDNAIRYTKENGEVHVNIFKNHKNITLQVADTGPGIPENMRERIFESFFRLLDTEAPGSGLGLAIVKQIAELHNAKITLATPKDGKGLQFNIAFPLLK